MISLSTNIGQFVKRLTGEGARCLDEIHRSIIDAVLKRFSAEQAGLVRDQLEERYFVSWMSEGRINIIFFDNPECIPLLSEPDFKDKLFKVELFVDGKKYTAHVTFYKGRIFSVELKLPRKRYKDKEFRVGNVTDGNPNDSFTSVIDRAEHGRQTDTNP